jgi:hypothetical protein
MDTNILNISSYIQAAVAPVFLLAGVAGLLNVFTGRLARIVDRLERIDAEIIEKSDKEIDYIIDEKTKQRRVFLLKRMQNINLSILFGTVTGFMVAMVILIIFASEIFNFDGKIVISLLFISSMISLALSLFLFLKEIKNNIAYIKLKTQSPKNK